jgi:hypothetical protein
VDRGCITGEIFDSPELLKLLQQEPQEL